MESSLSCHSKGTKFLQRNVISIGVEIYPYIQNDPDRPDVDYQLFVSRHRACNKQSNPSGNSSFSSYQEAKASHLSYLHFKIHDD